MSYFKKTALLVVFSFFVIAVALFCFFAFQGGGVNKQAALFEIAKGDKVVEISQNLKEVSIIKYPFIFEAILAVSGKWRNLQSGIYELSGKMSPWQITQKFSQGDTKKIALTIIEGWTAADIARALGDKQICNANDFVEMVKYRNVEGYLFPDTYQFSPKTSVRQIIDKMRDNFQKKTTGLAINEKIIIMASLLEKEVRTFEDKQVVAGILWKRLGAGWRLQVDAAPITYEKDGLPESPICNPGLLSIKAAIDYKESPYWFYLSAKTGGETIFSKTFDEHKAAKQKYLK